jgi:hypothetical protein
MKSFCANLLSNRRTFFSLLLFCRLTQSFKRDVEVEEVEEEEGWGGGCAGGDEEESDRHLSVNPTSHSYIYI